eukprot:1362519-Alexandrium_andersonii.AAC.1
MCIRDSLQSVPSADARAALCEQPLYLKWSPSTFRCFIDETDPFGALWTRVAPPGTHDQNDG